MANFSAQSLLDSTLTTPTEKRPPLPEENPDGGTYYQALIGNELVTRPWTGKKDPTKSGVAVDLQLSVQVPRSLRDQYVGDQITIRDSIMLDLTPARSLDNAPGRNQRLRLYREAIDRNKPGDTFSINMLAGQMIRIKIKHDTWEGNIQEQVAGVLRPA